MTNIEKTTTGDIILCGSVYCSVVMRLDWPRQLYVVHPQLRALRQVSSPPLRVPSCAAPTHSPENILTIHSLHSPADIQNTRLTAYRPTVSSLPYVEGYLHYRYPGNSHCKTYYNAYNFAAELSTNRINANSAWKNKMLHQLLSRT